MAYIYCIRHDNVGYIGKDSHSVGSLDRILAHVTNAFTKNSSDGAAYTINKWGYSGNIWRINDDAGSCFGVGDDAYQEFINTGWTTETDNTGAKLNFAEMMYTLAYSNSYASLNTIIGGTASRGQTPWVYDLNKDNKFKEFLRNIKNLKIQVPSFSMNGTTAQKGKAQMSLKGRSIQWGRRFDLNPQEDFKLVVHWQNIEDARTKLLHPYQYGVTRYICQTLTQFLSTDLPTLKYLIMKGIGCALTKNDPMQSDLAHSIQEITKSIYNQIATEAQKIDSTFYLSSELDITIFETLKPVVADVVGRVNKIIARGITTLQNMARQYREGIGRVNFSGETLKVAEKTFTIRPSKGLYRIPTGQLPMPKWYKMGMTNISSNNWIGIDNTPDEIKVEVLKTAYKHFKEVVFTSMEPIEGSTLVGDSIYGRTVKDDNHYQVIRMPKDRTLLEKVKNNWNDFLGLPVTSEWPIAGRLLISTVMMEIGEPLYKNTFMSNGKAVLAMSDDDLRAYWFTPAVWSEIVGYYQRGIGVFARPENWIYF